MSHLELISFKKASSSFLIIASISGGVSLENLETFTSVVLLLIVLCGWVDGENFRVSKEDYKLTYVILCLSGWKRSSFIL
jgi:hypothetical protein